MHILITGGTGFIGQQLVPALLAQGDSITLWVRSAAKVKKCFGQRVEWAESPDAIAEDAQIDAIINLAGEGIAESRWSNARKQVLLNSRVNTTALLVDLIERLEHKPEVLLSGSAIGVYGCSDADVQFDEDSLPDFDNDDFAQELCMQWEAAALQAREYGVRVCLLRTGIVLGNGGALAKMLPAFKLALGGPVGHGRQVMSWVHMQDEIAIILELLRRQDCEGPYNLTAPQAVTSKEFAARLGHALSRPAVLPLPALVPKLLLGEGADLLLKGQRVIPARLNKLGYQFRFADLESALADVL